MGRLQRTREIVRRRKRRLQLKKLRTRHAAAGSESERAEILAKARHMSPFVSFEETTPQSAK